LKRVKDLTFKVANEARDCLTELQEKLANLEKSRPNKGWDKPRIPRKVLK
jgi:hypothetical protein